MSKKYLLYKWVGKTKKMAYLGLVFSSDACVMYFGYGNINRRCFVFCMCMWGGGFGGREGRGDSV